MDETPDQVAADAAEILDQMRRLWKARKGFIKTVADRAGVTLPQLHVLGYVHDNPGASLAAISHGVDQAKSTVSGILDRLERDGWLRREADPIDRRNVCIFLSDRARQRFQDAPAQYHQLLERMLADYSATSRLQMKQTLETLIHLLHRLEEEGADLP